MQTQTYLIPKNYIICNTSLIRELGLECAVYLSEILNQCNSEYYTTIDRNAIYDRIYLSIQEQLELDKKLLDLNLIKKQSDTIFVQINQLCDFLDVQTNVQIVNQPIKEKSAKPTKAEKRELVNKNRLKAYVRTTNSELRDAYAKWIDSVFAKQGWMSDAAVIIAQDEVDKYTDRDLDLALEILKIAAINGYRDITWAINYYDKNKSTFALNSKTATDTPITLSDEVF